VSAGVHALPAVVQASIPSPTQGVWHLGPLPIRAYALWIIVGIVIAVVVADRRWRARGGPEGGVLDVSAWAVPFGIVGARIYHVVSSPQAYFGAGGHPLDALKIWNGGLGIWGAVGFGALGAWIGCRRMGLSFVGYADATVPGLLLAQAAGRLGNWFNNELYGGPTTLPWGLQVHEWDPVTGSAVRDASGHAVLLPGLYHPTFLYESLWCVLVAGALVWADRKWTLDHGRTLGLYVMLYTVGRAYFEHLRIDPANHFLGLRLNEWTSLVAFLGGLAIYLGGRRAARRTSQHPDRIPEAQDV
jgi:prolipoprotein diacylglyceryl transferase